MSALPRDLSSLFASVLEALRSTAPSAEQGDMVLFQSLMQILGDNWSPFDTARAPLQLYLNQVIAGDITREEYADALAQTLTMSLGDDADVSLELVSVCREQADPLAMTQEVCRKHLKNIVDGILDYVPTPEQPFSIAFRSAIVLFIGEWFDGLVGMFQYGPAALPGLLQHMAQLATRVIAQKSPQHAPMATMAAPMAMAMLQRLYSESQALRGGPAQ